MTTPVGSIEVDWSVYVIVDPRKVPESSTLMGVVEAALKGGAGVIQLRDKQSTGAQLVELARSLQARCDAHGAAFIVNDRVDVALAAGADGVHLGPDDIPIGDARQIAPHLILGASAGEPGAARKAVDAGADYLGVGAMFDARPSKPDASGPRGPEALRKIRDIVDVPIVGIGGITAGTAPSVIRAGADGVAVIREVVASDDPRAATSSLLERVSGA